MRSLRLFLPALILAAVAFVGCSSPTSSSSPAAVVVTPTVVTPTVTSVVPLAGSSTAGTNTALLVTFSVPVNPLVTGNFTLATVAATPVTVTGTVTNPTTTTATFTPGSLAASTTYKATLSTAVTSAAGVALATAYTWQFTTAAGPVAPTVVTATPSGTSVGLTPTLSATFSVPVTPLVAANFTLATTVGSTNVPGTLTNVTTTNATFVPTSSLAAGTNYTATLSNAIQSATGGLALATYTWNFTTAAATTGLNVSVDTVSSGGLVADANVTTGTVVVNAYLAGAPYTYLGTSGNLTRGATNYTGNIATLSAYGNNTIFRVFVKDNSNNFLYYGQSAPQVVTSAPTTLTPITVATWVRQTAVNLAAAGSGGAQGAGYYAMLTYAGVTEAGGATSPPGITGNVATTSAITALTGFNLTGLTTDVYQGSAQVTGNLYGYNNGVPTPANLTQAMANVGTAYTDAAGRAPDATELGAGDISGMTLVPGVYKWGTAVGINTGGLTLNGGPNDVWIFQIADALTLANNVNITLTGGAKAQNIFWQDAYTAGDGISVKVGTSAVFKGIVLAYAEISVGTGAVVTGELFSTTSIVALSANTTITQENHP